METTITLKLLLLAEAQAVYAVTEKLFRKVEDRELSWKPATGSNRTTAGQLFCYLKLRGKNVDTTDLWGCLRSERMNNRSAMNPLHDRTLGNTLHRNPSKMVCVTKYDIMLDL